MLALADPATHGSTAGSRSTPPAACCSRSSAVVGLASVLVSPAYLDAASTARRRAAAAAVRTTWCCSPSGRRCWAFPWPGNLGAAWLLIEATTAASALLVGFSGKPRALEAGWKYLILTSLGLGVALLGIVLLAAGVPGGGSGRSPGSAARPTRPDRGPALRRLPAPTRGARRQDRLGASAQLAARRPLRGAARRSRRCCRPRCCPPCCWSPGAAARARPGDRRRTARGRPDRRSASSRSQSRCRSSGGRWPGSGCSPTRASSTWA